jgi:hypothetical protein
VKRLSGANRLVRKRLVTLSIDVSAMKAKVKGDAREKERLAKSLERFLKLVKDNIRRRILCLRRKDVRVCTGKPTLRAGHLVFRPQWFIGDIERMIAALRALNLDVAHKILTPSPPRRRRARSLGAERTASRE